MTVLSLLLCSTLLFSPDMKWVFKNQWPERIGFIRIGGLYRAYWLEFAEGIQYETGGKSKILWRRFPKFYKVEMK